MGFQSFDSSLCPQGVVGLLLIRDMRDIDFTCNCVQCIDFVRLQKAGFIARKFSVIVIIILTLHSPELRLNKRRTKTVLLMILIKKGSIIT